MRARKPWGPEEGPLGKPKPQSWFELTSALLDTLTFFFFSEISSNATNTGSRFEAFLSPSLGVDR